MQTTKNNNLFYVYMLSDPITGTPFYVGKGSGRRCLRHRTSQKNNLLKGTLKKLHDQNLEPIIAKLHEMLDESKAFAIERDMIKKFGRRNLGTGSLCNLSDGGEGPSGLKHTDETKAKMSDSHKGNKCAVGYKHTPEAREKMSLQRRGNIFALGHKHDPETRRKMSAKASGRPQSTEHKARRAAAMIGNQNGLGHHHSPEWRQRLSDSLIGNTRGCGNIGKPKSFEHRRKLSLARGGDGLLAHILRTGAALDYERTDETHTPAE